MLRLCTVALALMACGVVAAPAPVFRPGKTPYEVMVAGLRKTGKATGPRWTLTVEKVEGDRLGKVELTIIGASGHLATILKAKGARITAKSDEKNIFTLVLDGVVFEGAIAEGTADQMTVELTSPP